MKYHLSYHLLLLFVLLTAGISSCSYQHYKGLEQVATENKLIPEIYDTTFNKAVYSTVFSVFGQELTGITIVKKVHRNIHVVFMSQIGLKFFDIEIRPGKQEDWFHINFIMESLSREFIVNTLKTDFMLLFAQYPKNAETAFFKSMENETTETTIRFDKYTASVFTRPASDKPNKIELRKGKSVKATIRLTPGNDYPEKVDISNRKAGLQLEWEEVKWQ